MTWGKPVGIPVGAEDGVAPDKRVGDEVAIIEVPSHIVEAESVPVGKTEIGAGAVVDALVVAAEVAAEVAPTGVLDATEDPVTEVVPLVPEVAEADTPEAVVPVAEALPVALPVVKEA